MQELALMTDQTDQWRKEIEGLSNENSAKILSIVLGITRGEAADKILEVEYVTGSATGFRQVLALGQILGHEVHTASKVSSHRTDTQSGVQFLDKFPSVGRWLEKHPDRLAILRCGSRFVYVGSGVVFEVTATSTRALKVTHVIFLDEEG